MSGEIFRFISTYFSDYLNNRAHKYIHLNFETEKTYCPFIQTCRKKYIGFKANEKDLPMTMKGISEKNSSKVKLALNSKFVTTMFDKCCLYTTLKLIYHYIGVEIVQKMKDGKLEPSDMATRRSNSKLSVARILRNPDKKKKFEMMVHRTVKHENRRYPFRTIREHVVYIDSLDPEHEPHFSLYPADLVKKNVMT